VGDVVNRATTNWCVAAAPTPGWAKLVYPSSTGRSVHDRLGTRSPTCRLDGPDPAAAWQDVRHAHQRRRPPHGARFDAIRLHGPGTDLTVGLFPSSTWHAADFVTVDGLPFPNLPSEEMFTTPDPLRAGSTSRRPARSTTCTGR
jgi:aminopeptidase